MTRQWFLQRLHGAARMGSAIGFAGGIASCMFVFDLDNTYVEGAGRGGDTTAGGGGSTGGGGMTTGGGGATTGGTGARSPGDPIWARRFGDSGFDTAWQVAVDPTGNILVFGCFEGTLNLGGAPLVSKGGQDLFVLKLDPDGDHLWSRSFGNAANNCAYGAITADAAGDVIVSGWYKGTVDFGGGLLASAGDNDHFLVKYDPSGNHLWSKRYGDAASQTGLGIATDAAGNLFLAGSFKGTVDYGCGPLGSNGAEDGSLAKLSPQGTCIWSRSYGGPDWEELIHLGATTAGRPIVAGGTIGGLDLGDGLFGPGFVLAKFESTQGDLVWNSSKPDGSSPVRILRLGLDPQDNSAVTGSLAGSANLGGDDLFAANGTFLARFDSDGAHLSSRGFENMRDPRVATGASGKTLLAGEIATPQSIDVGTGLLSGASTFVALFDADLSAQWAKAYGKGVAYGAPGFAKIWDVAIDSAGDLIVVGLFVDTVDFGSGPLLGAGGFDMFVVKLAH